MKKRVAVNTAVFVVILLAVFAWFFGYYHRKSNDNLPNPAMVAEMEEAEANDLLAGYRRIQLREVWQEPDEIRSNEDIWGIDEWKDLVVWYDDNDKVAGCRVFVED